MKIRLYKEDLQVPFKIVTTGDYNSETRSWDKLENPYKRFLGYKMNSETIKNFIFEDILTFMYFSRGRSSVKAHFTSTSNGNQYEMFIKDLEGLIISEYTINALEGRFCFRKQGANFGVVLIEEEE